MKLDNLINDFGDGSGVFFTSDTHFGHNGIIECTHRPFKNSDEMDEALIALWNQTVGPNDIVFHLGDFCWGGTQKWVEILKRLNGVKYLIILILYIWKLVWVKVILLLKMLKLILILILLV